MIQQRDQRQEVERRNDVRRMKYIATSNFAVARRRELGISLERLKGIFFSTRVALLAIEALPWPWLWMQLEASFGSYFES